MTPENTAELPPSAVSGRESRPHPWEARRERLPRDHGHLAMMDASMAYLGCSQGKPETRHGLILG